MYEINKAANCLGMALGIDEKTMYKIFDFLEIYFYFIAHFLERGGGLEKCNLLHPQNLFLNVASIS